MIFISQGHFTFELTLAGLLEDILTRFKDERVLLTLSDSAIGIKGQLFIAESTIFAAHVERPPIEGYAALRNLCQFAGAEYALSKYEEGEPDPTSRSICIDLAKLIKIVPSLPVDPTSLVSSEALVPRMPVNSVVGAPVVVAVPPMQLPPLPPPGAEFAQSDDRSSSTAKKRIDEAFEAALQKRAASKGGPEPLNQSNRQPAQPLAATPAVEPANGMSKLAQAAAMLAGSATSDAASTPEIQAPAPVPMASSAIVPSKPLPASISVASQSPVPSPIASAAPTVEPVAAAAPPVIYQNAVGLGTGEIDWHAVRESAKKVEPVSKEPTVQFSLAEQIQQELAASDEEEEVAEPLKRQALKKTFFGPLAALRFFTGNLGRLLLPLAVIVVLFQGGKLWVESHGGMANFKALDFLNPKAAKPGNHKDAAKPAHVSPHHETAPHHEVTTHHDAPAHHEAAHPAVAHAATAKPAATHSAASKATGSTATPKSAAQPASKDSDSASKAAAPVGDKIIGTGSSKYPNSLIMRDHIKPSPPPPPRRHAYQTAPDAGSGGDSQ